MWAKFKPGEREKIPFKRIHSRPEFGSVLLSF